MTLRDHSCTFYIVYPDPDHGIFVLTAPHPAGPWSAPHLLLAGHGLIDPCPLWDEDGRAHLVHGWAKSRARVKNQLSVLEVTSDLTAALSPTRTVIDGDAIPGMVTLEGDRKSTRLNSSHVAISYAVFCLKKKKQKMHKNLYSILDVTEKTHARNQK